MAISYSTALQSQIALLLTRSDYSSLRDEQQKAIDNEWTSGTVGGAAGRALSILGQYANQLGVDDVSTIPDTWDAWFTSEAALQAAPAFPTAEVSDLRRTNAVNRRDAISSYARVNYDSTADGDIGALTVAALRAYVVSNAIRGRESVFIEPAQVDAAIEEVVTEIWNEADWTFKTQVVQLSIATNGTVTSTPSIDIDKVIGDRIQYDYTYGGFAIAVDYPTLLQYKASNTTNDKPAYFHLLRSTDDLSWQFERTPDQTYTARAYVTKQTPSMTTLAEMNTALGLLPTDFRPIVRDRVLAVALQRVGRANVADRLMLKTTDQINGLLARYDNPGGAPEWSEDMSVRPYGMGFNPGMIGGGGV